MLIESQKILIADTPNANNRIYSLRLLRKLVDKFKPCNLIGQIGMGEISVSNISHCVKDLRLENNVLVADIETLPTEAGKVLEELFNKKEVAFRISGIGSGEEKDGFLVINDDYKLKSVNAVPIKDAS